jgi:flagellar basal-body rod modification protein FlgD
MAIESIGRVGETPPADQVATLGLEEFLTLFLTQLNYQDPLEPVDQREFLAQLAQFASLEIASRSNENTAALLDVTSLSQSIGLLGRTVDVRLVNGTATGQVIAMRLVNDQPQLTVTQADGSLVFASPAQVISVIDLGLEN